MGTPGVETDLRQIAKLLSKYDHSSNRACERAAEAVREGITFTTVYGDRYLRRLGEICVDEEQSRCCIVCQQKYADNRFICKGCLDGINEAIAVDDSHIRKEKKIKRDKSVKEKKNALGKFVDVIDGMAEGNGHIDLKVKDLFSEIRKPHTSEEAEQIFICGTATTTPPKHLISREWPKPWLYFKVAVWLCIAFIIMFAASTLLGNTNSIPGLIILGSLIVPAAVLIMFFEMNAPRNISIFTTMKVFGVGGCASILAALILFIVVPVNELTNFTAFLVGLVEELAKLIIVVYFIKKTDKAEYLLNGLLIGAAVGAGFAAFESAGYAFTSLLYDGQILDDVFEMNVFSMIFTIIVRGILAPGGHVAWAAMSGFGVMMVKGDKPFKNRMLFNRKFLMIFSVPVIMHALWDMPFLDMFPLFSIIREFGLVAVAWIVLIVFVDNGFDEVNRISREGLGI